MCRRDANDGIPVGEVVHCVVELLSMPYSMHRIFRVSSGHYAKQRMLDPPDLSCDASSRRDANHNVSTVYVVCGDATAQCKPCWFHRIFRVRRRWGAMPTMMSPPSQSCAVPPRRNPNHAGSTPFYVLVGVRSHY